jgi:hypothetical protein
MHASQRFSRWILAGCLTLGIGFLACGGTTPAEAKAPDAASGKQGKKRKSNPRPKEIRASDYSQSCKDASECVAIYEGNGCAACRCANAAIRKDQLPRYERDLKQFESCFDPSKCAADCIDVTGGPAACTSGTCVYDEPE